MQPKRSWASFRLQSIVAVAAPAFAALFVVGQFATIIAAPWNGLQFFLSDDELAISSDLFVMGGSSGPWVHFDFEGGGFRALLPTLDTAGVHVPLSLPALLLVALWMYDTGYARAMRRANPDACRRCGYPLDASGGPGARTCPECGTRNPPARTPQRAA